MPWKRPNSPYYYIRRRKLPGYGDTGKISSRVTSKKLARDMERCLEEIAQRALMNASWTALLDAVCKDHTIDPPELLAARNRGELEALKAALHDPSLKEAVGAMRKLRPSRASQTGLDQVLEYAPNGARLSLFRDGRNITDVCLACENDPKPDGTYRKRNSVRRYLLREISMMLRHFVGQSERDRIFADVNFPAEDDTREIYLSPADVERLYEACRDNDLPELEALIRLALQTSADRGVLLAGKSHHGKVNRGLLVSDVKIMRDNEDGTYFGEIYFEDTKTQGRSRTVGIGDLLARELLVLCKGKEPSAPVFEMEYMDLDYPWQAVRAAAELEHVRFKDLRAQTAIYAQKAGIPQSVIQASMGHASDAMTRRYQKHQAQLSREHAQALERQFRMAK